MDDTGDLPQRLRAALSEAAYAHDTVVAALGEEGHRALGRNETRPGLRATTGGTPVETLTRLAVDDGLITTAPDGKELLP